MLFEVDRDAVVAVYQEKGVDCRCTMNDVSSSRKKVVASTIESEKRMRKGTEIEKQFSSKGSKTSLRLSKKRNNFQLVSKMNLEDGLSSNIQTFTMMSKASFDLKNRTAPRSRAAP